RLQGAVKGEENRIQRQVRLDRRHQELPVRLQDLRRGGAPALSAEGGAVHDLRPLRRRLEDLDHAPDRALDAPQPVANLVGLEKPTAAPMGEPGKPRVERIALLPDFGDQNLHDVEASCSWRPFRLSKMSISAGW